MFWDCGKSGQDDPVVSPSSFVLFFFFLKNDGSTLFLPRIERSILDSEDWENKIVKLPNDFRIKLWNPIGLYCNGEVVRGFQNVFGDRSVLAHDELLVTAL